MLNGGAARCRRGSVSHYHDVMDEQQAAEDKAFLEATLAAMAQKQRERLELVAPAKEALRRLVDMCGGRSGQAYKVRALLWSLYNGKPASLIECLGLDWNLRKDFCAVLLAFGFEHKADSFFYRELSAAFAAVGLLEWFKEESETDGGGD